MAVNAEFGGFLAKRRFPAARDAWTFCGGVSGVMAYDSAAPAKVRRYDGGESKFSSETSIEAEI